jgi:hypothetical protein
MGARWLLLGLVGIGLAQVMLNSVSDPEAFDNWPVLVVNAIAYTLVWAMIGLIVWYGTLYTRLGASMPDPYVVILVTSLIAFGFYVLHKFSGGLGT